MQRHHLRPFAAIGVALAMGTSGACSNDPVAGGPTTTTLGRVQLVAALQPFDRCDDALAKIKEQALAEVGPYGLGGGPVMMEGDVAVPGVARSDSFATAADNTGGGDAGGPPTTPAPMAEEKATDQAAMGDGATGTGTNNQEADVDEADIVKTDGSRIVTLRNNELVVADISGGGPRITGRLQLGDNFGGQQIFLRGDRVFVMGSEYDDGSSTGAAAKRASWMRFGNATIIEVELAADGPKVAGRTSIEGSLVDGRMSGGTLRLVLTTPGGSALGFVYPSNQDPAAEKRAEAANREVIQSSTLDDWVPNVVGPNGTDRALLDCDHLYRPAEPSGFSTLSILTITDGLDSLTGEGVLADGQITYGSTGHVYVATTRWQGFVPMPSGGSGGVKKESAKDAGTHTDIHAFATPAGKPATYEASGRITGSVLNQYSMSESKGILRVATTTDASGDTQSQSGIVTLRRDGAALVEAGRVDGLGVTETIRSVRYVGDTAYVVTFRQTDPLYVVDLSDPTAPKKLGELKVPGFSSYLHPVGDHLVLGVGSDATEEGRITGAKLSLFDTSDPLAPKELSTWTNPSLGFMVDGDPKAFGWDADRSTAYLPYSSQCVGFGGDGVAIDCSFTNTSGVLVVKVADGKLTELGRIDHSDRTPTPAPATTTTTTTTTTAPSTTVPETTVPETTTPSTTEPELTEPEARATETTLAPSGASDSSVASPPICDPAACDPAPYPQVINPTITRVFVIGDLVYSLSDVGVAAHTVDGLRPSGFAAF